MTMNDVRGIGTSTVESGSTPKIVAAVVVALGFGAIGALTYESGMWNPQPKQVVASKPLASPGPLADAEPSVAPPQSIADLPPEPVKNVPAQASPQAAAAPPVKIARAQTPAPALAREAAVQPSATIPTQASPVVAAPGGNVSEQPVSQVSNISPPVNTPSEAAPAQAVPAQPAETPPPQ